MDQLIVSDTLWKLMADDFANNGFDTFIPDYLKGDPIPIDDPTVSNVGSGLLLLTSQKFNVTAWLANHGVDVTLPILTRTMTGLRREGFSSFISTGYCFGFVSLSSLWRSWKSA